MVPVVLQISITSDCNLNCRTCGGSELTKHHVKKSHNLTFDAIKQILDEGRKQGNWYLAITGGEPLLHPQILEILSYAERSGYWTYVLTNGLLLNEELIQSISNLRVMLRLTIYSADKETHEHFSGDGTYDPLVSIIRMLRKHSMNFGLGMPVFMGNVNNIENTIKFALEEGSGFIRISPAVKYYRAQNEDIDSNLFEKILSSIVEARIKYSDRIDSEPMTSMKISNPIELLTTRRCTAGCNYYHVDSEMIVYPCPYISIKCPIRHITFNDHSDLNEMYAYMDKFFETLVTTLKGECKECEYNVVCAGGCLAEKTTRGLDANENQPICLKKVLERVMGKYDAKIRDQILQYWAGSLYRDEFEGQNNCSCIRNLPLWTITFKGDDINAWNR